MIFVIIICIYIRVPVRTIYICFESKRMIYCTNETLVDEVLKCLAHSVLLHESCTKKADDGNEDRGDGLFGAAVAFRTGVY